jgi:archaellum biogenesis ATPase FlaH
MPKTTLDFSAYIAERTHDFTGRKWVFTEIDRWLADPAAPRYFIITGEPGIGKTAIAARLTQVRELAGFHFCIARQADTIDPLNFTRSLSHQLTRVDGFALDILEEQGVHVDVHINVQQNYGQIIGVQIEQLVIEAPSAAIAFNHAVLDPLKRLYAEGLEQQLVIVVDALDEAVLHRGPEDIVDLLANARGLPSQVRFVLTMRPENAALRHFEQLHIPHLTLDTGRKENLRDLRAYVRHYLRESVVLRARLKEQDIQPQAFMDRISEASDGNFLYLVWLLRAIAEETQRFDTLEVLPQGLDGIYREFLRTRPLGRDLHRWRERYRPLLGTLAAAQAPLTAQQLVQFTDLNAQQVHDVVLDVQQFLDPTLLKRGQHQLYHQSVADFLDSRDKALEFWIDLNEWHRRIVKHYRPAEKPWAEVAWEMWDAYGLRYLVAHLVCAEQADQLDGISKLFSRKYLDHSKRILGSEIPFLNDVTRILLHGHPVEIVDLCRRILYRLPANSYRALSTLKTLVGLTRADQRLRETLDRAAQDMPNRTMARAILVLASEGELVLFQELRELLQKAPAPDAPLVFLAYGLAHESAAQRDLLNVFTTLDRLKRLYREHYVLGWYAAEGLRELGPERCAEDTVAALVQMLQAPQARNQMWAVYILSRWGRHGVARLGEHRKTFEATIRRGLRQRRSEQLSAKAADAVGLLPGQIPKDEAIRLLSDVLGLAKGDQDAAAASLKKWLYAKKRAAVALARIAGRDQALLDALRDYRDKVGLLTVEDADKAARRGLEEALERAIHHIALRESATGFNKQPV